MESAEEFMPPLAPRPTMREAPLPLAGREEAGPSQWSLALERRYHDDEPLRGAEFEVELENGEVVEGKLSSRGEAKLSGLTSRPAKVRFGPDARAYERIDRRRNPELREELSQADAEAMLDAYGERA